MTRLALGCLLALFIINGPRAVARDGASPGRPAAAPAAGPDTGQVLPPSEATKVVQEYCATCHSERGKAGGLTLARFDAGRVVAEAATAELMIHKLRAGMMPPPGARRPAAGTLEALATTLEERIDAAAAARPYVGWRPFARLTRAEYARSVRALVGLDVDVTPFLPPDTLSEGFDNVADVQISSATLMEGYLRAARRISLLAVGDRHASTTETTYRVPRTASQLRHVDGAPMGTRGGVSVEHVFPADGQYRFRMMLFSSSGELYGNAARNEQLEVSVNGVRAALMPIDPRMSEASPNGMNIQTPWVHVAAGPQRVSAAFLQRSDAPVDDLIAPIEHTLADGQIGLGLGVTTLPHLFDLSIQGPRMVTGVSDTVSRRKIFQCRPTTAAEEGPCARRILRTLATQAYRGRVTDGDIDDLLGFYTAGREAGDFETGIQVALQAILASPHFLFRMEPAPADASPGTPYRLQGVDLASRLSYFLWGEAPDAPLRAAAASGALATPAGRRQAVGRMLVDPRAEALASRFAVQWLRLQDLEKIAPDPQRYPQYDHTLGEAMATETRLFFEHLVRADRSVLELLTADYTFVNERLARHYGIPHVSGRAFRQVSLAGQARRGLLGQGSILTLTSVADRTSPVLRGKWVMEVLLGSPPPPPPPNVPALAEMSTTPDGRLLSVRERMEQHRASPACSSCHRVIDPLGLALEHFDVTGAYRIKDSGQPIDASGTLYDGSPIDGPEGLREAVLRHKDVFLRTFTRQLLTYALGRRVEAPDMPTVRAIVRTAAAHDYRMSAFITGIVESAAFQMNEVGMTPATSTDALEPSDTGHKP